MCIGGTLRFEGKTSVLFVKMSRKKINIFHKNAIGELSTAYVPLCCLKRRRLVGRLRGRGRGGAGRPREAVRWKQATEIQPDPVTEESPRGFEERIDDTATPPLALITQTMQESQKPKRVPREIASPKSVLEDFVKIPELWEFGIFEKIISQKRKHS